MKNGNLFIMVGIPGSGKTTFAKEYAKQKGYAYVSRDEVRFELVSDPHHYFDREHEVYTNFVNLIVQHLQRGETVIADATHISPGARNKLREAVDKHITPISTSCLMMATTFEECYKRNLKREGLAKVPDQAMYNMNRNFKMPNANEKFDAVFVVDNNQIVGRLGI